MKEYGSVPWFTNRCPIPCPSRSRRSMSMTGTICGSGPKTTGSCVSAISTTARPTPGKIRPAIRRQIRSCSTMPSMPLPAVAGTCCGSPPTAVSAIIRMPPDGSFRWPTGIGCNMCMRFTKMPKAFCGRQRLEKASIASASRNRVKPSVSRNFGRWIWAKRPGK